MVLGLSSRWQGNNDDTATVVKTVSLSVTAVPPASDQVSTALSTITVTIVDYRQGRNMPEEAGRVKPVQASSFFLNPSDGVARAVQ